MKWLEWFFLLNSQAHKVGSHNQKHNWSFIGASATVESVLIQHYWKGLLGKCSGACIMRSELQQIVLTLLWPFMIKVDGVMKNSPKWEFTDMLASSKDSSCSSEMMVKDTDTLKTSWDSAQIEFLRDSDDTILKFIQSLEENKLLACSDYNPLTGTTQETLPHHYITGLIEVPLYMLHSICIAHSCFIDHV